MILERKQQIKDEMIAHLAGRLDAYWQEHHEVTTTDSWGEDVTFAVPGDEIAAATDRILQSAGDRIVLFLLNDGCLDPHRLEQFVEPCLKEARTFLEEQADAVAAEL